MERQMLKTRCNCCKKVISYSDGDKEPEYCQACDAILKELPHEIYAPWAYTKHEFQKHHINRKIYHAIKDKADVWLSRTRYAAKVYEVIDNPHNLSEKELALIADNGNLCFGYRTNGDQIIIHTD